MMNTWEKLYREETTRHKNRYPNTEVVGFIFRNFGNRNRSETRILDLGCGWGNNLKFLHDEGFDAYGIDNSETAISHCKTICDNAVAGDISVLPYPDEFFDAVIDRQTLDQNSSFELPGMVMEIYRVLKPGGIYFGINLNDGDPRMQFGKALGNGDYIDFTAGSFKGIGKRHFFSLEEIRKLFSSFRIEDIQVAKLHSLFNPSEGSEEFVVQATKPGSS